MKGSEKINIVLEDVGLIPKAFSNKIGLKNVQSIYDIQKDKKDISQDVALKIVEHYPEYNIAWLRTGEGEKFKNESVLSNDYIAGGVQFYDSENRPANKKLIPLYDDVGTIGGRSRDANITSNSYPSEWIDPGDWFKSATAALRHYDDSMHEYPSGCILPLKEVYDRRLLVPGKDYVIETGEYRITKKLGKSEKPNHIKVHSTNEEKREDGTLIHDSFDIDNDLITIMYEVLGYVVKKGGGTIVFSNQKK